jgi:signal transduction histidine kinase
LGLRGIKTKIGLNVLILILLSAAITDILVVVVVQKVMVRWEISRSTVFLENIGDLFFSEPLPAAALPSHRQDLATSLMLSQDRIKTIDIVDSQQRVLYQQHSEDHPFGTNQKQIQAAMASRKTMTAELGYTWALFWWQPSNISISIPIQNNGILAGIVAAVVPLAHIHNTLELYHKPIFFYLIINTCVLTIAGLYRIFRLYLSPIDRIIMQADDFHETDDIFFAFRQEDNELNRLSSSLNRMLNRISSDKKKLQTTVLSLERANIELKNAQKEIIRAEKMASVGRLAAGIAHEIGNPIGIVLGYLDMLKRNGLDDEDKIDFLKRTEDEVQRINEIIRQLLDLARPTDTQNHHVNVSEVIQDIVDVMQLQPMMHHSKIELYLHAENDSVWGNADQLRQVFLNLLLNAADSIKGGASQLEGRIKVSTTNVENFERSARPILVVEFQDNGNGIDSEKLQNIFDPFFTTKEPGKGTGLGLSVSYMIIEGMGGTIRAESRLGHGATFKIELPLNVDGH